jgi:hypothetical protein
LATQATSSASHIYIQLGTPPFGQAVLAMRSSKRNGSLGMRGGRGRHLGRCKVRRRLQTLKMHVLEPTAQIVMAEGAASFAVAIPSSDRAGVLIEQTLSEKMAITM